VVIANEPPAEVGNGVAFASRRISTLDEVVVPEKLEDAEQCARVITHILTEGSRRVRAGIVVREEGERAEGSAGKLGGGTARRGRQTKVLTDRSTEGRAILVDEDSEGTIGLVALGLIARDCEFHFDHDALELLAKPNECVPKVVGKKGALLDEVVRALRAATLRQFPLRPYTPLDGGGVFD
jgi:hypothetical protein